MDLFPPFCSIQPQTPLSYFLQKHYGLLTVYKSTKKKNKQTQTETTSFVHETTQTQKPGLLWGYFS